MRIKRKILLWMAMLSAVFGLGVAIYFAVVVIGTVAIDEKQLVMNETSHIYDTDGELIAKLFQEDREVVDINDVPSHVQNAFVAIEDVRFYNHQGIDPRAIGRALYRDILAGARVEGGSTITQQLAKNVFLTHDKTLLRKTKEVLIAMSLERKYSKDEILGFYLNNIYFGHGATAFNRLHDCILEKMWGNSQWTKEPCSLLFLKHQAIILLPMILKEQNKEEIQCWLLWNATAF